MDSKNESFKERLNQAINIRSIKAIDLADKVNTSRALISQYLNGKAEPRHDKLHYMALVLNVSPIWLMGYDVPMESQTENNPFYSDNKKDIYKEFVDALRELELNKDDLNLLLDIGKRFKK